MHCRTCGERLSVGQERCPTCGAAALVRAGGRGAPAPSASDLYWVERCPRCGYRGEGVGYFSRATHLALLAGAGILTWGLGALAYWLLRRNHRICPRCGIRWEHAEPLRGGGRDAAGIEGVEKERLPSRGLKRRVLGVVLLLASIVFALIGFDEPAAFVFALLFGSAGAATFYFGQQALKAHREALLEQKVLRLAKERGGTLTVTEVASDLNLPMPRAESLMVEMDDGFRIRSEVTREGLLVYEFPEVMHRRRIGA